MERKKKRLLYFGMKLGVLLLNCVCFSLFRNWYNNVSLISEGKLLGTEALHLHAARMCCHIEKLVE